MVWGDLVYLCPNMCGGRQGGRVVLDFESSRKSENPASSSTAGSVGGHDDGVARCGASEAQAETLMA